MKHKLNQDSGRYSRIVIANHVGLRNKKRCEAVAFTYGGPGTKKPRRSSWRCTLVAHHSEQHASRGGHRTWDGPNELFPPYVEQFWTLTLKAWRRSGTPQDRIDEIIAQYLMKTSVEQDDRQLSLL